MRLVEEDDKYSPQETMRLLRHVAQRDQPIAFINLLGSANVTALLKDQTLEQLKIPAVGITPGADVLRTPGSNWMFHVHASDNAQLKRILGQLNTMGLKRIAVPCRASSFRPKQHEVHRAGRARDELADRRGACQSLPLPIP